MIEIKYKNIKEVKPYPNNPRINDEAVGYVANSIAEFGFKVPIIIDRSGEIVAGHTRVKAAKKLGIDEVPCVVADDLTDEQIKAFRLADNKVAEFSRWDIELLISEIDEILDVNMGDFGFSLELDNADMPIDLDEVQDVRIKNVHRCPKCGFEFEV